MRKLGPPVTEREICEFELRACEKIVGELEVAVKRRLGVAYTQRERKRDRLRLVAVRETLKARQAELAAIDAKAARLARTTLPPRRLRSPDAAWRKAA